MKNIVDIKNSKDIFLVATIFVVLVLLLSGSDVRAGIPVVLSIDPAEPRANQSFDLVYGAFCEDVFPAYSSNNRSVQVEQGVVRVTVRRLWQFCLEQPFPAAYRWRIGPLPPGDYHIELVGYEYEPQDVFPIASGEITIAPTLAAPQPNVIPIAGKGGFLLLSILVVFAAIREFRWR